MPATITKGQTFGSTEQITNTKLHNLVDAATISGIEASELATNILGSLPSTAGTLRSFNLVTSLASGAAIRYDGAGGLYGA